MDPVSMITGVVLAGYFGFTGFVIGHRIGRTKSPKPAKTSQPLCGCDHHVALHNEATGNCHGMVPKAIKWDEYGEAIKWEEIPCRCQRYVGPLPLQLFMNELPGPG